MSGFEDEFEVVGIDSGAPDDEQTEDPWTLPPSRKKKNEAIPGPFPAKVRVIRRQLDLC